MMLQPSPERLAATPYWAVHRFGIERRRFAVIPSPTTPVSSLGSRPRVGTVVGPWVSIAMVNCPLLVTPGKELVA